MKTRRCAQRNESCVSAPAQSEAGHGACGAASWVVVATGMALRGVHAASRFCLRQGHAGTITRRRSCQPHHVTSPHPQSIYSAHLCLYAVGTGSTGVSVRSRMRVTVAAAHLSRFSSFARRSRYARSVSAACASAALRSAARWRSSSLSGCSASRSRDRSLDRSSLQGYNTHFPMYLIRVYRRTGQVYEDQKGLRHLEECDISCERAGGDCDAATDIAQRLLMHCFNLCSTQSHAQCM